MRTNEGVEWALHCCAVLALLPGPAALPAHRLAEFHGVPPAYLAKHLQLLSRAGVVESVSGPRGGYRLSRPAGAITLLDVVTAVEGAEPLFRCTEIRRRGPAAAGGSYRGSCVIDRAMRHAEQAWQSALRVQTVGDLVDQLGGTGEATVGWLAGVLG